MKERLARIVHLYGLLLDVVRSPVVELNRAVAVAMAQGPAAGLPLLDQLEGPLTGYCLLPATRADLLRRLGRHPEAAQEYEQAILLDPTAPERDYLFSRLDEVTAGKP